MECFYADLGRKHPKNILVLIIFKVVCLSPTTFSFFFFFSSLDYKPDCGCQVQHNIWS